MRVTIQNNHTSIRGLVCQNLVLGNIWMRIIWTDTKHSEGKREKTERQRRQCGEDLCVGPVCWLWAWSFCGPFLCNIHHSLGSNMSACGSRLHTCKPIVAHQFYTRQTYGFFTSIYESGECILLLAHFPCLFLFLICL